MSVTMLLAVFSSAQMSVTMLFAVFSDAQGVRGVLRLYHKKSTFQPRKLRVSAACYVCTAKVDFPATEAPRVRGVLRLYCKFQTPRASAAYYVCTTKSRLSSHGSSACPRRTTFVLQKSNPAPEKPANSGTMVFARVFGTPRCPLPCSLRCFQAPRPCYSRNQKFGDHGICDGFGTSEFGEVEESRASFL